MQVERADLSKASGENGLVEVPECMILEANEVVPRIQMIDCLTVSKDVSTKLSGGIFVPT